MREPHSVCGGVRFGVRSTHGALVLGVTMLASLPMRARAQTRSAVQGSAPAAPPAAAPTATATALAAAPAPAGASVAPAAPAASSAAPANPQEGLREAQLHLQRALDFFRRQDYTNAIHEFELAHSAAPSADILYNIARAHELQSHFDEAVQFYQRYLRDKVDPPDRADVERRIRELSELAERRREAMRRNTPTAQLRFEVNRPGARLFIGEREVGVAPVATPQTLEPGPYELRATADGMQDWRTSVRLRRGDVFTARVDLQPATRFRTTRTPHVASFVIGGVGVAGVVGGTVLGVLAATQNTNCASCGYALGADVTLGASAVVLLGAVVVYFIEAGSSRTERLVAPPLAPAGPATPTPPSVAP